MRVEQRRFLRACTAGLSEKTALCRGVGQRRGDPHTGDRKRIRDAASALCPQEPLYGVTEHDWPTAFLMPADSAPTAWLSAGWAWWLPSRSRFSGGARSGVARPGLRCGARLSLAIPGTAVAVRRRPNSLALRLIPDWLGSDRPEPGQGPQWLTWLAPGRGAVAIWTAISAVGWPISKRAAWGPIRCASRPRVRRGMPLTLPSFVQIGWGANDDSIWPRPQTGWIAMGIARNKGKSIQTMADAAYPSRVPSWSATPCRPAGGPMNSAGRLLSNRSTATAAGGGDRDRRPDRLERAFTQAARISPGSVLVEEHCPGDDHRLLVVRGTVVHVARRAPAAVVGDGVSTVRQLVDQVNADPLRGTQRYSMLRALAIDAEALDRLSEQGSDRIRFFSKDIRSG